MAINIFHLIQTAPQISASPLLSTKRNMGLLISFLPTLPQTPFPSLSFGFLSFKANLLSIEWHLTETV